MEHLSKIGSYSRCRQLRIRNFAEIMLVGENSHKFCELLQNRAAISHGKIRMNLLERKFRQQEISQNFADISRNTNSKFNNDASPAFFCLRISTTRNICSNMLLKAYL
jgi:hypothetical protein